MHIIRTDDLNHHHLLTTAVAAALALTLAALAALAMQQLLTDGTDGPAAGSPTAGASVTPDVAGPVPLMEDAALFRAALDDALGELPPASTTRSPATEPSTMEVADRFDRAVADALARIAPDQ